MISCFPTACVSPALTSRRIQRAAAYNKNPQNGTWTPKMWVVIYQLTTCRLDNRRNELLASPPLPPPIAARYPCCCRRACYPCCHFRHRFLPPSLPLAAPPAVAPPGSSTTNASTIAAWHSATTPTEGISSTGATVGSFTPERGSRKAPTRCRHQVCASGISLVFHS